MESNLNWITLPLNATDAVYITAPYLCHLTIRKGAAQLVVSVTVAMSSLFLSGWSMFQFFAPWVVTYNSPKANHCIGHVKSDLEASSCSDDEMKSDPEPSLPAAGKTWGMDARSLLKFPPAAYLTSDSGKSHGSTVASTLMVDTSDFQKEEKYHLGQDFSAIMMDRTLSPCGSIKSANEEEGRPKHPNAVEATTPAPITLNVEEGAQQNASHGDGHSRKHSGIEPNGGVGPSSSPQTQNVATDPRGQYPGHAHTASNGGGGLPSAQDSESSSYSGTHSHLQGVYCSPGSDGTPVILDQRYRQESNGGPHVPHAIGIREERTRDSDEPDGRWNGASLSHVRNLAFPSGSITSAA
ncbi:hypothetical protein FRB94_000875 [Tulasnella sp. JGI-2019a]|nr:hypothetical protein FRB94_000875 [Tulasnella sp. JGI-2019a]KAG9015251.1 hypothetical protein FRB93_012950 [Tulasnella sp. JGI-2019a]